MIGRVRESLPWIFVAVVMTCFTVAKPLHIDDTFYYFIARQIAGDPSDPYGFSVFWSQWPGPAIESVAPAALSYWLALPLKLFGESPSAWKAFLFPVALILILSARALGQRVAPGMGWAFALCIAFSPAVLPGFNLMLDVPQLAFALGALALMARACDRGELAVAVMAGLVAGVAAQIKYNGLLLPGLLLVYGLLFSRPRLGVIAAAAAIGLFLLWEAGLFLKYGTPYFFNALFQGWPEKPPEKYHLYAALFLNLGMVAALPAGAVLWALAGTTRITWLRVMSVTLLVGVAGGWAALPVVPSESMLAMVFGLLMLVALILSVGKLLPGVVETFGKRNPAIGPEGRLSVFLLIWLIVELAAHAYMSPFGAMRRVMVLYVVVTLIYFRAISQIGLGWGGRRTLALMTFLVGVSGIGVYVIDWQEADASRRAANDAAAYIRRADPSARMWYAGHWGFAYYAEQQGMHPLIPDYTHVQAGDWLVLPDGIDRQDFQLAPWSFWLAAERTYYHPLGLRTVPNYYAGSVPVRRQGGPQIALRVFRATEANVPASPYGLDYLINWISNRKGMRLAGLGVPALMAWWERSGVDDRRRILDTLVSVAPQAKLALPLLAKHYQQASGPERLQILQSLLLIAPLDPLVEHLRSQATVDPDESVRALARRRPFR